MKVSTIVKAGLVLAGIVILAKITSLAWMITGGLRPAVRVPEPDYWPTNGWRTSTPEAQGFDSQKLAKGLQTLKDEQVKIDSLMIIRNGYVILDAHFSPYNGIFPHDMASVTKSVTTTLIAIAAAQGKLDLDQTMISFFPGRTIANLDERKSRLTVRHLVGMVNGMESGCFDGDAETLLKMRAEPDWVQAALDRPMVAEPGKQFCYDSPGSHILSAILQEATGMTELEFGRQYLFEPLGIRDVYWEVDPQGYSRGWGDLHLLPEDAAKIGFLWLQRGNWDGRQVVPEAWVLDSVKPHSKSIETDYGYGYGWWVSIGDFYAVGRGGQRVRVMAIPNTLVVTTGADLDYAAVEAWLTPMLLQLKDSRPANPQAVAALEKTLALVGQDDEIWTASPIPGTAAAISGKTYMCAENPAGLESVSFQFDGSKQGILSARIGGQDQTWPIGLDGHYRLAADGAWYRGYWESEQIFHLEGFDIGILKRRVAIEGDGMQIEFPEFDLSVACKIHNT